MDMSVFVTLGAGGTGLLMTTDYVVIVVYLVGIIVLGSLFARGQKNSDDYFVASRRMHWFPLALSIWASLTSANSMLGAPSYGYSQDLQYVPMAAFVGLLAAMLVIYLILPLLHRLKLTTAYTYLEKRYNLPVRCAGSALFMALRGGWLASVIFVPSLALSAVIPLPKINEALGPIAAACGTNGSTLFWIVIVGAGATIYTTLGGLKAVIWTDVVQFFVFVIGLAAIWFMLIRELPDGLSTLREELGKVPRAYVGADREVGWGQTVVLDGSQSNEFEGKSLEYEWRQVDGSKDVELDGANTAHARFTAPEKAGDGEPVTLTFALRVTTTAELPLQSPPAVVKITVCDNAAGGGAFAPEQPPLSHSRPHDTWFDFSFRWNLLFGAGVTFWLLLFNNIASRVNDAGTDQVALQRYFSAETLKESKRAIWMNAICDIPLMPLMFLTGAGVLVYYAVFHNPDVPLAPGQAMPFFVAHKLNDLLPGLSGLFIAALFAATMSSVDSGINSLSATVVTDWYRRLFVRDRDERHYLSASRWATLVLGVLATFAAMFMGRIGEVWQIAVAVMGLFMGPLLGIFLLGFFTTRANSTGVLIGAVVGFVCTVCFQQMGGNEFLFALVGLFPTLILGYLLSLAHPPRPDQIDGLTAWTKGKSG